MKIPVEAPMTNYPTYSLDPFWEVWDESPQRALIIIAMAIDIADWSPRKWARVAASRQAKAWVVLGEDGQVIVCKPKVAERLVKAGYQYA